MTKYFFAAIAMTAISLAGCKKSNSQNSNNSKTPRTDVPAELQGNWIWADGGGTGLFDPNTGVYQGPAIGMAEKFSLNANGTGSVYYYIGSETDKYNIYKEGTYEIDVTKKQISFHASGGFYQKNGTKRNLNADELYPSQNGTEQFYYKVVNLDGKIYMYKKDDPSRADDDYMHTTRFSKL